MSVFNNYARYYDLLYKDKDYLGETEYVDKLLSHHGNKITSLLELGCGTGKHALLLAEKGYRVTGIDQSEEMLEKARLRAENVNSSVRFMRGDVRSIRVDETFDAAISLFHVISYQVTNEDLANALMTASVHLKPNGFFLFDFWYGPTVLNEKPEVRVKRLQDEAIEVTRIAEPKLHSEENTVDVNYSVFIRDKKTNAVEELQEKHCMRYLFLPELSFFIEKTGMQIIRKEEWMSGKSPGSNTWGVVVIAQKTGNR